MIAGDFILVIKLLQLSIQGAALSTKKGIPPSSVLFQSSHTLTFFILAPYLCLC
jgi:hypothetical protein